MKFTCRTERCARTHARATERRSSRGTDSAHAIGSAARRSSDLVDREVAERAEDLDEQVVVFGLARDPAKLRRNLNPI
jgi:hypothetical protein